MHKHLTHNKSYATYREFAEAALEFLRENVPTLAGQCGDEDDAEAMQDNRGHLTLAPGPQAPSE